MVATSVRGRYDNFPLWQGTRLYPTIINPLDVGIQIGWCDTVIVPTSRSHNIPQPRTFIRSTVRIVRVIKVHRPKGMTNLMAMGADTGDTVTFILTQF